MSELFSMDQLRPGEVATVQGIALQGNIRRRMQDLGLICGTRVACVFCSPLGDPAAYRIRGAVIALRAADSGRITLGR